MSANHSNAGAALKSLVTQEAIYRAQDIDKNGAMDYWAKNVGAFYGTCDTAGKAVALIDLAFAQADIAPGYAYKVGGTGALLSATAGPKQGYWFQTVTTDQNGAPYCDPTVTAQCAASPLNNATGVTNSARFGFSAVPAAYNSDGVLTFVVGEDGVIWQQDVAPAAGAVRPTPVANRSTSAPPGTGTRHRVRRLYSPLPPYP